MLIAVSGSSGLGGVVGVEPTRPGALLEAVRARPASHVVLLAPRHSGGFAREQAHVVIAAEPRTRVCVLDLPHHVLTLDLLGALALEREQGAAGGGDAGAAVSLLTQSSSRSRSLVWHPRALGFAEPEPSLGQRFSSVFVRRGYLAEVGVDGLVAARDGLRLEPGETLYAAAEPSALLRSQLGQLPCHVVASKADGDRPYAGSASVELSVVVAPPHPSVVSDVCVTCGVSRGTRGCVFCGAGPRARLTSSRPGSSYGAVRHPAPATSGSIDSRKGDAA